jgi:hypothetical protein
MDQHFVLHVLEETSFSLLFVFGLLVFKLLLGIILKPYKINRLSKLSISLFSQLFQKCLVIIILPLFSFLLLGLGSLLFNFLFMLFVFFLLFFDSLIMLFLGIRKLLLLSDGSFVFICTD